MLKEEQETIFRWDSAEEVVHAYSCHPPVWRKLEKAGFTSVTDGKVKGKVISKDFRIPLDAFRWRIRTLGKRKKTGGKDFHTQEHAINGGENE